MTNKHRVHYNSALSRDKQLVCKGMACWMHCTTGSPNGDTASKITKTLWSLHCDFQELAFCILKWWLQARFAHICEQKYDTTTSSQILTNLRRKMWRSGAGTVQSVRRLISVSPPPQHKPHKPHMQNSSALRLNCRLRVLCLVGENA